MKNRARQRENRRLKAQKYEKPWLNPEGYMDLTPYKAIQNITRQEKEEKKKNTRGTTSTP